MRSGRTGRRGWGGSEEGIVWAEQGIVWAEVIRENGEAGPGGSEGQGERGGGGRAAVEGVSGGVEGVGRQWKECRGAEEVMSGVGRQRKECRGVVVEKECCRAWRKLGGVSGGLLSGSAPGKSGTENDFCGPGTTSGSWSRSQKPKNGSSSAVVHPCGRSRSRSADKLSCSSFRGFFRFSDCDLRSL